MRRVAIFYQLITTTSTSAFTHHRLQYSYHHRHLPIAIRSPFHHNLSSRDDSEHSYIYNNIVEQQKYYTTMPNGVKKENLPTKICVVCNRPFNWRKKWEKVWDDVTTCSKSCNRKRKEMNRQLNNRNKLDDANSNSNKVDHQGGIENDVVDAINNVSCPSPSDDVIKHNHNDKLELEGLCDDILEFKLDDIKQVSMALQSEEDDQSSSSSNKSQSNTDDDIILNAKQQRKAEKKRKKAERRAQREGRGDPSVGQKQCTICNKSVNLLIRCTYDKTGQWGMVCGKCWKDVSGGVVDGDDSHPYYRYGGLWKNRRAQQQQT